MHWLYEIDTTVSLLRTKFVQVEVVVEPQVGVAEEEELQVLFLPGESVLLLSPISALVIIECLLPDLFTRD